MELLNTALWRWCVLVTAWLCWFCIDMPPRCCVGTMCYLSKETKVSLLMQFAWLVVNAEQQPGVTVQSGETSFWVNSFNLIIVMRNTSLRWLQVFGNYYPPIKMLSCRGIKIMVDQRKKVVWLMGLRVAEDLDVLRGIWWAWPWHCMGWFKLAVKYAYASRLPHVSYNVLIRQNYASSKINVT